LAAGGSRRMGSPKQLLDINGEILLARAVATALSACCRPVIVVCGASYESVASRIAGFPVEIVRNVMWDKGIGTSIRAGIAAASAYDVGGAVIALADQPLVTAAAYDNLVHA